MFESQNPEKINIKDLSLDRPEKEKKTPEELREEFRDFLSYAFGKWYSDPAIKISIPEATNHTPELILPQDQEWQKKKEDRDPSKFGEYTLNPETIHIDWGTISPEKIITKKLDNDWNNKPLADVAEYIIKTYGTDYYIPGLEYQKYILEHSGKAPDKLKDGNWHFFFGSILRGAGGSWDAPGAGWYGARLGWAADWIRSGWSSNYRVVLLEKSAVVRKPGKDFLKPTPPMPEIRKF